MEYKEKSLQKAEPASPKVNQTLTYPCTIGSIGSVHIYEAWLSVADDGGWTSYVSMHNASSLWGCRVKFNWRLMEGNVIRCEYSTPWYGMGVKDNRQAYEHGVSECFKSHFSQISSYVCEVRFE